MSKISPIKDSILFEFCQTTKNGYFRNETQWGFELTGVDFDAAKARWGVAKHVGPDCKDVKVGDFIMIDALKWTTALEFGSEKLWRTAEEHVMLTSDTKPEEVILI